MKWLPAVLTGASLALLALLGSNVIEGDVRSALAAPDAVTVDITEDGFEPASITVAVGGSVSWTNRDSDPHSVIGEAGSGLESPSLSRWGLYSRMFRTAGTITYHDGFNPELTGVINVVNGDGSLAEPKAPVPTDEGTDDRAVPAPNDLQQAGASSATGMASIDAGTEWFGSSSFMNGVYEITIQAGDTVKWSVVDGVHTVYECGANWSGATTCTAAAWNSDILAAGDSFFQAFPSAGTYYYLCTLHPLTMRGTITVEGSAPQSGDDTPPTAPAPNPPADPVGDAGPSTSGPGGANAPSGTNGPDSVPSAGFGPPASASGLDDYLPLSVLMMAAAGATFLASSFMMIRQRMSVPRMAAPPNGRSMQVAPGMRPRNTATSSRAAPSTPQRRSVVSQARVVEPSAPPSPTQSDLDLLNERLASIQERTERLARWVVRE